MNETDDCPVCGKNSGHLACVSTLGEKLECINCGAKLETDHDYSGIGTDDYTLHCWLITRD